LFSLHPDWVTRTRFVADRCRFSIKELSYRFPYEITDFVHRDFRGEIGETADQALRRLTYEGALGRYGEAIPETVATQIWELDRGVLATYDVKPGRAYSMYVEERTLRREQQRRDYEAAMSERQRQRAVIDELRTHGSHTYSHVRSREKALERVADVSGPRAERRAIGVALTAARRPTRGIALEAVGLAKAYDRPLFTGVSAAFARGGTVAIVGPNGAGKTTLLRILAGDLAPDRGNVRYGTGLTTASYSQTSVDDLPAGVTAAEAVMRTGVDDETARGTDGVWRFTRRHFQLLYRGRVEMPGRVYRLPPRWPPEA